MEELKVDIKFQLLFILLLSEYAKIKRLTKSLNSILLLLLVSRTRSSGIDTMSHFNIQTMS